MTIHKKKCEIRQEGRFKSIKMSDNVDMTPEARWRHLREHGPKTFVDLSSHDLVSDKPSWFDEARFKQAKEAVQNQYIG